MDAQPKSKANPPKTNVHIVKSIAALTHNPVFLSPLHKSYKQNVPIMGTQRGMCNGMVNKPIAFRPSKKSSEAIDVLIENKEAENVTEAVNKLIEKGLSLQIEHPEDVTGLIIPCPMREAKVDTSVCKTCHKYPCDTWEDIKSWAKVSPQTAVAPNP